MTESVENALPTSNAPKDADELPVPICGMVRPIAEMGSDYPATHWAEVHDIVAEAADAAGYRLRLVSESDQAGIIVSHIVNNLFSDPIVICDVSARNPNVMFELGMRITFQKPVIIITDYDTPFSFDITPVKHLQYRRDLRLGATRRFQLELQQAIVATVEAAKDPSRRDYLQQFGPIEVTGLRDNEVDLNSLAASVRDIGIAVQSLTDRLSRPTFKNVTLADLANLPPAGSVQAAIAASEIGRLKSVASDDEARASLAKLRAVGIDAEETLKTVERIRLGKSNRPTPTPAPKPPPSS